MALDIKAKIEELVKKITSDKSLQADFQKNPVQAVKKLTGVDIPDSQVDAIVTGIKAKLGADKLSGIADGLGGLFGKK